MLQTFQATGLDEAALSPDGTLVARGHRDGTIELVAVNDGAVRPTLRGLDRESRALGFSRDGTKLAAVSPRNVAVAAAFLSNNELAGGRRRGGREVVSGGTLSAPTTTASDLLSD
jgi:hypothetical protein